MTHFEIENELLFLDSNPWGTHTAYPVSEWKYQVANDGTRQGYRDWLYNKLANEEDEE